MRKTLRIILLSTVICVAGNALADPSTDESAAKPAAVQSVNEKPETKPASVLDATLVTTRQLSGQTALHRGCDFPTLVCHQGKPEVCLQEAQDPCNIESCILVHESKHLEDIASERLDVCEGRKDGQLAQTPMAHKVVLERSAIKVEQSCLQSLMRQSDGECKRRIAERLKRVARFDNGCVQGAQSCKSPLVPFNPKELASFCSLD